MDNILHLKSEFKTTEKYFTGAKRQLFTNDFDHDLGKYDMTGIVPLPILKDHKPANYLYTSENTSKDDGVGQEWDEYDYDSDCSLGSMNSLFISLKESSNHLNVNETNEKNMVQLKNKNNIFNDVRNTSEYNFVLKNQILEKQKACYKIDSKSEKKLSTTIFYGKKISVIRQSFSCLPYTRQIKKERLNSKLRKTKTSVFKFQQKFNKLRMSLKHQHRNLLKSQRVLRKKKIQKLSRNNTNLIRHRLQETIPLIQFTCHKAIQNTQNSEEYSLTNSVERNEIDFDTFESIKKVEKYSVYYDNFENQMTESNIDIKQKFTTTDDFKDFDGFEDTLLIEDIINRLYDES